MFSIGLQSSSDRMPMGIFFPNRFWKVTIEENHRAAPAQELARGLLTSFRPELRPFLSMLAGFKSSRYRFRARDPNSPWERECNCFAWSKGNLH
jgi:hypothetical protein